MREIEVVLLDTYHCMIAKDEVRKMFGNLDLAREKSIPLEDVLEPLHGLVQKLLLEADESELTKYFNEKERKIIHAYRRITREVEYEEEDIKRAKEFLASVDFETFSNLVLKLAKLHVSWECLRNPKLGERVFEEEFDKITKHFRKWKKGEIDYERFRNRTAKLRKRIDDKMDDLFSIIWGREAAEEERRIRTLLLE